MIYSIQLSTRFLKPVFSGFFALLLGGQAQAFDPSDGLKILTGTQSTFSLTAALVNGTKIEVINVPEDGRRFYSLRAYLERRKTRFAPLFKSADVVVSLTNVLPADPLFRIARDWNIRIINIDAAQPWSFNTSGVTIVTIPTTNVPWAHSGQPDRLTNAPYFWLSLTNAIRMADILGSDLARIFTDHAAEIAANRDALKRELRQLYAEYQQRLLQFPDTTVFALANEFVYLTNDLGLFVDGYFLKQDIDWSEDDLANFTHHLKSHEINIVIHKWEPNESIQSAIAAANARLVVLDTADPGMIEDGALLTNGYQRILRNNLESIERAFKAVR